MPQKRDVDPSGAGTTTVLQENTNPLDGIPVDVQGAGSPSADQQTSADYPQTLVDTRYEFHSGIVVLPTAAPDDGGADEVTRLHRGFWQKVTDFSYERNFDWPQCPSPYSLDPNEVLTYGTIVLATPLSGPDGLLVYRVSGTYVYRLLKGLPQWGPFPTTSEPSSANSPSQNLMPATYFTQQIDTSHIQ